MTPRLTERVKAISTSSIRSFPLTAGALVAAVLAAVWVANIAITGEKKVKTVAIEEIRHHAEKDVDTAHPGLTTKYTTKQELDRSINHMNEKLNTQYRKLDKMEIQQSVILDKITDVSRSVRRRGR